ncbi:MAG TPA: hypothetical protein VJ715_16710 [Pyrinomonadaceae bacterium]|nr:hypothetical protein [Pyrinomonadaceae bacterium]
MTSNRARKAAQAALNVLNTAERAAAVASEAAEILRGKEDVFESAARELGETQRSIHDITAEIRAGKSLRTVRAALRRLAEQLHAAEAVTSYAARQMREVTAPPYDGETMKESTAESAKAQKGGPEKARATKASEGKEDEEDLRRVEELRAAEAEAIEKVTDILHQAGSLKTAEALSRIGSELKRAEDTVKEAADELRAAEMAKKDLASKKVANALKAVETAAGEAIEKLKTAEADLTKTVEATQKELKQPTYEVWKSAWKRISDQAKIVDHAYEEAKKAFERSGSSDDESLLQQLKEYKANTDETKKEARNSYDSAMVMERLLDVREFFLAHKDRIYSKLEDCDQIAKRAITNTDMLFFAESLPIINGIIHVGSTREDLNKATEWVRENWEGSAAQPRIVLSALLFHYVTKEGVKEFTDSTDQSKRITWSRIDERVGRLL